MCGYLKKYFNSLYHHLFSAYGRRYPMGLLELISLVGGLAFFLYGMNIMSTGLEKLSGGSLETNLKKMTDKKFKGLLLGAGITMVIQSSSAVTVMLVGLVNSGLMNLSQTVGVIMGTNVGTTITAWILSLVGLEGSGWIALLQPKNFSPILALIGVVMIMMSKNKKKHDIGSILIGFAILMYGMTMMSSAVEVLSETEQFTSLLTMFKNPILCVIIGALFTAIIQSSSASVGILQTLALTGGITYGMAIPLIMGQNIGTCVTAFISSIGVNKNAKRVAFVHLFFNLIGTSLFLSLFYLADAFIKFGFLGDDISPFMVAICHTIFNIATTVILFPCSNLLVKLANVIVKDSGQKEKFTFIDERLLATPSIAVSECFHASVKMSEVARSAVLDSLTQFKKFDPKIEEAIQEYETELDKYEDKLGSYLVKLSSTDISVKDSRIANKILHSIGDFERIGDHALSLLKAAKEIYTKKISFSTGATRELTVLAQAITEILDLTMTSFASADISMARRVEPLEQVIDKLTGEIKSNHIKRLQSGDCTIELGFILSDLITNFSRISDHCSNIAVATIEVEEGLFDTHKYLNDVKTKGTPEYEKYFDMYNARYSLS